MSIKLSQRIFFYTSQFWLAVLLAVTLTGCLNNGPLPPLPAVPAGPTVRVAILMPASGELATLGRMMRNGIDLAFDEWNRRKGIESHRIEAIVYPTDCTFETAQKATRQAIADGLQLLIGPICSEAAIAAAVVAESAGALLISPAATHPLVTVDQEGRLRSSIFRVSYSYEWQGQAAARFARETLEIDRVALLTNPTDSYTTHLADEFAQTFVAQGGLVVHQATYEAENSDFTEALTAIEQSGAELIYLPASHSVANRVAHRLHELGLYKQSTSSDTGLLLLGSDAWQSAALDLSLITASYYPIHFLPSNRNQQWIDHFMATYAVEPDPLAALGYDAANMLVHALEQVDSSQPALIAAAMEQGTFKGVTGQLTFDTRHNPHKPIPFLTVLNGDTLLLTSVEP